jgi:hypothetical protein
MSDKINVLDRGCTSGNLSQKLIMDYEVLMSVCCLSRNMTVVTKTHGYVHCLFSGHDTGPEESGKKYRPLFLDHFDKKEAENIKVSNFII